MNDKELAEIAALYTEENNFDRDSPHECLTEIALEKIIDEILKSNPPELKRFRGLHNKTIGHLMGEILTEHKNFSPTVTREILEKKLREL